jgi:hypothetical protein
VKGWPAAAARVILHDMRGKIVLIGALAAALGAGCVVHGRGGFIAIAPPAPRARVVVESRPEHVWVEGHWVRVGDRWEWDEGHWERERPGRVWVQGRWDHQPEGWVWIDGHWQ